MAADLQSALVAAGEHLIFFLWNLVESRSNSVRFACKEPRYLDFQSSAYTKSAKVPLEEAKGFEPLGRFTALWFSRPVQ